MGKHEQGQWPENEGPERGNDRGGSEPTRCWQGQHWLITGAAGSLGSSLAREWARQGAVLVLLDKNKRALDQLADEIEKDGGEAPFLFPLDLGGATPEDYQRFAEALHEHIGHLNGVMHCAAHFDGMSALTQVPAVQWWVGVQANLNAPLLLTRELLPLMREGSGRIVFMLDELDRTAMAYWGVYGVSQWGLHALVQQLAVELSNGPVQVTGMVLPAFQSGMRAKAFPAEAPGTLPQPEALATKLCRILHEADKLPVISNLESFAV